MLATFMNKTQQKKQFISFFWSKAFTKTQINLFDSDIIDI